MILVDPESMTRSGVVWSDPALEIRVVREVNWWVIGLDGSSYILGCLQFRPELILKGEALRSRISRLILQENLLISVNTGAKVHSE